MTDGTFRAQQQQEVKASVGRGKMFLKFIPDSVLLALSSKDTTTIVLL